MLAISILQSAKWSSCRSDGRKNLFPIFMSAQNDTCTSPAELSDAALDPVCIFYINIPDPKFSDGSCQH